MHDLRKPWYFLDGAIIFGAEDDDKGDDGSNKGGSSGDDDDSSDEDKAGQGADDKSGKDGEDSDDDDEEDDKEEVKVALRKERRERKKLERENKKYKAERENKDKEEASEIEAAKREAEASKSNVTKLADKLLNREVKTAIERAARDAKFIDPSDATGAISLEDIDYEQDEDDPSEIEIDEESVTAAVKKLAKKRPHWVQLPGGGTKSGSKMAGGGDGNKDDQATKEAKLKEDYPSLR